MRTAGLKTKIPGSGGQKVRVSKKPGGDKKKSGIHKCEKKSILMHIMPMYKRERVRILVMASSLD